MRVLIVHHNTPGQFGRLARALAARGHDVTFIGQHQRQELPGIRFVSYAPGRLRPIHFLLGDLNRTAENGRQVFAAVRQLANDNWIPDLVIGHDGWGEMSFIKDVLPQAKVVSYFEFYYSAEGADVGFDPEYRIAEQNYLRLRTRNLSNLIGLEAADTRWTPTVWQKSRFPAAWQAQMSVVHDGIDTDFMTPCVEGAHFRFRDIQGRQLPADAQIITYVARNLEPYRGFHILMRALPKLLAVLPNAYVIVVGGDAVSYGAPAPNGRTWRQHFSTEVAFDPTRVLFLGRVPYATLRALFQSTSAHVYLTYPFVLSWSLLEAMACGAAVVASRTPPVTEVITDNENGFLFDFFDVDALVQRIVEAASNSNSVRRCRRAARNTAVERYDFQRVCLPLQTQLLSETVGVTI